MSRPVFTVSPSTPLKDAARLLVEHGISSLPVLDARGTLVGIVSEADLMPMRTQTVGEVMTRQVLTLGASTEVSRAARSLLEAGMKRMPVVRGRRVVGIVSRRDLIRVIARWDDSTRPEILNRIRELGRVKSEEGLKAEADWPRWSPREEAERP